jgi:hypothetical protein
MSSYVDEKEFYPDIIVTNTREDNERYPLGTNANLPAVPVLAEDNTGDSDSQSDSEKEYKQLESDILSGDAKVIPNPNRRAKTTIRLQGLGVLTGLYYVNKVAHTFSKDDGYTQVITVEKNGIGDSVKRGVVRQPAPPSEQEVLDGLQPLERGHATMDNLSFDSGVTAVGSEIVQGNVSSANDGLAQASYSKANSGFSKGSSSNVGGSFG